MRWQDMLGIQDWDGNPNNAWDTNVNATVNPDGTINFTGFYGDYNIGAQNGFANLVLLKGTTAYSLNLLAPPQWYFWNTSNNGNWTNAANWTNGVPDGIGHTAHFGAAPAPRTVTVNSPITVGMINFNSAASYTVDGTQTITLDGPAGVVAMNVVTGSHTISAPIVLNDDLRIAVTPLASTLTLSGNLNATDRVIAKSGAGAVQLENIRAAGLGIADGTVRVSARPVSGDPAGTSNVKALSIASTATLDITNNAFVVDYDAPDRRSRERTWR